MAPSAFRGEPWFQAAFALVTLAGLTIVGATVQRATPGGERITAPRRLQWLDPDGRPLAERDIPPCADDGRLRTLVHDDVLWMACLPSVAWPSGAYARVDPARGQARAAWPLPAELPLMRTEGLAPGPEGRLAIAYRALDTGQLVVGLAEPTGWARPPEVVDARANAVVVGLDWVGADLELVTVVASGLDRVGSWNRAHIINVPLTGLVQRRPLDRERICSPEWLRCEVQAALRQSGARVWRFLVAVREPPALYSVVETGLRHPLEGVDFPWDARQDVDLTVVGVLIELTLRLQARLTPEGEIRLLDASDLSAFAGWAHDYIIADDRLATRPQYRMGAGALLLEDERGLVGVEQSNSPPARLNAYRVVGERVVNQVAVATTPPECPDMHGGSTIPRSDGACWLVSARGCYLALEADLARGDRLSFWEHLRTRGSRCVACNARHLVWFYIWILTGLPICLAGSFAFIGWRRRHRRQAIPLYPLLTAAVLVYDLSAAFMVPPLLVALTP